MNPKQIIVALDVGSREEAMPLIKQLAPYRATFKLGLEAINAGFAHSLIPEITSRGGEIFWDIKLHDIPNTVYGAAKAICGLNVSMFNLHASCEFEQRPANKRKNQSFGGYRTHLFLRRGMQPRLQNSHQSSGSQLCPRRRLGTT